MRWLWLALLPCPTMADALVSTRPLAAGAVLGPGDVALVEAEIPGALASVAEALGQSLRLDVTAGRPLRAADLERALLVRRNQMVTLIFATGTLTIRAEGKALGQGGAGERLRVLNLGSKTVLSGVIRPDGTVELGAM